MRYTLNRPWAGEYWGVFQQFPGIVHPGTRRGIHFDEIHKAPVVYRGTRFAVPARLRDDAVHAIQRLGKNTSQRGLADAAGAREQVSVMETLGRQRVHQRLDHVLLANHLPRSAAARHFRARTV